AELQGVDVVVSAAGVAGLIGAAHIRDGAILVDVSIIRTEAGLVGDVDLASVEGKASVVTHVPDGIGPITTACLFENVVAAAAQAGR
ncbi:MAG: bifunctional 5,10-methylenetetrahydrofolate dehydrogenase/5,10-methenyltetrahydrofolate cyclohydrolase, partial [Rhizobiales bacterium]|nr:bifunctional 5,10-methylenetetrahydrofolate dehydrogenase/5,10-methenyltetrahydrofolate cyclohydrolase [Hyphomicrobiales bacterium]